MKKVSFLLLFCIVFVFVSCSKQPKEIIIKAVEKCKSITYGSYEMSKELVMFSDTMIMGQTCMFKKLNDSSEFPLLFNSVSKAISGKLDGEIRFLCTDDKFIWYMTGNDSVASFIFKTMINEGKAKTLFQKNFVYGIYYPITYQSCYPLDDILNKNSDNIKLEIRKEEFINGKLCYVIISKLINKDGKEIEYCFWISKEDYLVLSFITIYKKVYKDMDIMEKYTLTKYDFDTPVDVSNFNIPQHTKLIDCSEEYK